MWTMKRVLAAGVVLIAIAAVVAAMVRRRERPHPPIRADMVSSRPDGPLFVLVPGVILDPATAWSPVAGLLEPHGSILRITYDNAITSNLDPVQLSGDIAGQIEQAWQARGRPRLVLIGHSIGALLLRQAFLDGSQTWGPSVSRIVLLAGMNRGWDISGRKPLDMGWLRYLQIALGAPFGRLFGQGRLIFEAESGAAFVANLRLEWMEYFRDPRHATPEVVQLLGDIDDIVSDEDNKDLRAAASEKFVWLRVRGTGHADIIEVEQPKPDRDADVDLLKGPNFRSALRAYRGGKILRAATSPFDDLTRSNEEQPFKTDDDVTDIVFVLHGIRDLGEWSSIFEQELMVRMAVLDAADRAAGGKGRKLAVASARYGYFGMGPFLLRMQRGKYVRWFMDTYTETRARYPNARHVHFFGHSNGTYLLSEALEQYARLKVDNVAFAGSVVRREYDWCRRLNSQVQSVRNYVASDDRVVALFPRLFEQRPFRWLGNDIGSAGFNGFLHANTLPGEAPTQPCAVAATRQVENVGFIDGGHSAFIRQSQSIAAFLLRDDPKVPPEFKNVERQPERRRLKVVSDHAPWSAWLLLLGGVIAIGALLAFFARRYRLIVLAAYVVLLVIILEKI